MTKIVAANRRFSNWSRGNNPEAWKILAIYEGKDVQPSHELDIEIFEFWERTKDSLGYASFEDLSKKEILAVVALSKTASASLGINRWGDVTSFKLKSEYATTDRIGNTVIFNAPIIGR